MNILAFIDEFRTPHISSMSFFPKQVFRTPHFNSKSVLLKATVPKPINWLKHSGLCLVLGLCPVELGSNLSKDNEYPEVILDFRLSLDVSKGTVTLHPVLHSYPSTERYIIRCN